ncbi:MAG: ATP-dependent 6-phosphofructokinase [Caldithrix sp.]|nr:ATP-dependent 6-phosphofructokinase [Caldithrix sp.]
MSKLIGVLTAGGDTPGLNAALRGIGKAAINKYGMQVIGFLDGFRGLMENRSTRLDLDTLSGILTKGGTILGTSRDKPHRMPVGGKALDMTDVIYENYQKLHLETLICLGGGGTQKNALRLTEKGLNVITLPKTIDNDVALTDTTFGFDTALSIATEAIDRLHSTAHSHHRIIVVEVMGHKVGWLALGAGLCGGADVILIPEIPYDLNKVAEAIMQRSRGGKRFSIVAVAEGALSKEDVKESAANNKSKEDDTIDTALASLLTQGGGHTMRLANRLEELTGLESRLTILGHLQRGGAPSAADRLLATQLGTASVTLVEQKTYNVMVSVRDGRALPVPLKDVAGNRKYVPLDHPWIESARRLGTCLGDD